MRNQRTPQTQLILRDRDQYKAIFNPLQIRTTKPTTADEKKPKLSCPVSSCCIVVSLGSIFYLCLCSLRLQEDESLFTFTAPILTSLGDVVVGAAGRGALWDGMGMGI